MAFENKYRRSKMSERTLSTTGKVPILDGLVNGNLHAGVSLESKPTKTFIETFENEQRGTLVPR